MHDIHPEFDSSDFHGLLAHLLIHELESPFREKMDELDKVLGKMVGDDEDVEVHIVGTPESKLIFELGRLLEGYYQALLMSVAQLDRAGLVSVEQIIESARDGCEASDKSIRRFSRAFERVIKQLDTISPIPDTEGALNVIRSAARKANLPTQEHQPEPKPGASPGSSTGDSSTDDSSNGRA